MSGKCRPALIKKVLKNVKHSNLSQTDKDCIQAVFEHREKLRSYQSYFNGLYGEGLAVANWHENGELEPLDNFIDSAEKEMEKENYDR